jgi:phosphatidylserine decarboxylase
VALYARVYDVELDECEPTSGWDSFDAFFTRRLRPGARPVDADPARIVSPADGRVESMGRIDDDRTFLVKGRPYRVDELVGDVTEARRYVGGAGCVVYLSPRDYHRVHAPVAGVVRRVCSMPGDYFPVNSIGVEHVPRLFVRNRRVAIGIDTADLGRVTMVMVSAMIVGRITLTGIDAWDVPLGERVVERPVARGDEIGMFHLGSTVVLLVERPAAGPWIAGEGPIRMGEALSRCAVEVGANGAGAKARVAASVRGNP